MIWDFSWFSVFKVELTVLSL